MGKVLIALCTVFLLAFPARGEQTVTWESLTVWNDLPPLYDPAPWPSDLAGKRVILRWNGKHNGDLLLDYLHSLLSRAFPDTEFIKAYETDPALSGVSKDLPESEATARTLLELRPDLVIAATGDCRACSAWLAIDQIQLERAGVPTLTILTQPFLKTFHNVRQNLRIGPLHCITVPHPVAIIRDEKVRAKVDEAFPAVDCGLSHKYPGKAAMPPPSQRRPIPKRRLASLPEKSRPHGVGQREISLFRPVPCGRPIHSKPIRDRRRSPIQKRTLRHCAERPFSTWHRQPGFRRAFSIPGGLVSPKRGSKEGSRLIPDAEVTGWPFEGLLPQKPSAEG